mgnify:CR=1 FL=1
MLSYFQVAPQDTLRRERTVLVRGFDANLVSEHQLVEHFAKLGKVDGIKIVRKTTIWFGRRIKL